VITLAQAMAGVEPDSIGYVEAHGTGTPLGDPIEIAALTQAFGSGAQRKGSCAIGSVKTNIGHLDATAGVAGLIKTTLALRHRLLPPSLHFETANPAIDFSGGPFYVNNTLRDWKAGATPRRAGVSSFGIGGTNAHVILEEAPAVEPSGPSRPAQLLVLSARSPAALESATQNLASHLERHSEVNLADAAHTLQTGRRELTHRRILVCRKTADSIDALRSLDSKRVFTGATEGGRPAVVFLFPGQGAQHVNMALELYQDERVFRQEMDFCCDLLQPHLGMDLRSVLYPGGLAGTEAELQLTQTAVTQPALFAVEYALAKLWISWGVRPEAMMGHSLGEYVAACLAGVLSPTDALGLVAARGRLMQQLPAGAMLAVSLAEAEVQPHLNTDLSLSVVNGASLCVVSGPRTAIESLKRQLTERNVACRELQTSHAFHSRMMDPILEPFMELVRKVKLNAPTTPFISNVTGTWITPKQATDPCYWSAHLRHTVRFADGLGELMKRPESVFVEVGPGETLTRLARQHPARQAATNVLPSLPRASGGEGDTCSMLNTLGRLWLAGLSVDWRGFYSQERRRRVRLPTYAFERKRHWIEPARASGGIPAGVPHQKATPPVAEIEKPPGAPVEAIATPAPSLPKSKREEILSTLKIVLGELSGLNLTDTTTQSTFAELGFDSLFLTQASLAIEKQFHVRVAFRQLMDDLSTIALLAAHIESVLPTENGLAKGPAEQSPRPSNGEGPQTGTRVTLVSGVRRQSQAVMTVPLTEAQKELWFASQVSEASSCAYNESRLLHVRGLLRPDALRDALRQVVSRHEALRTTFTPGGDAQRIHGEMPLELPVIHLARLDPRERAVRLEAIQIEEARLAFDLVNGPLLRARLIEMDEGHSVLVLTVHHLICDGFSLGIVLRELCEFQTAECGGVRREFPMPLQLSEYVRMQARRQQSGEKAVDEAYWLKQFSGECPVLDLPTDHARPLVWTFDGALEGCKLTRELSEAVRMAGARSGCTVFTMLLAAFKVLLHRLTGQDDIVVGVPTADRAVEGADTLVGHCVHFLPVRSRLTGDPTFFEFLASVKSGFLEATEHQSLTFGGILQSLGLTRDPGRMPLVSVTFNLDRMAGELNLAGFETRLEVNPHNSTQFDLGFNVTEISGVMHLDCRFNTALFEPSTIRRWLAHFQTLLGVIAANPERKLSEVSLLNPKERQRILVEWNNTTVAYPRDKCLHQVFEDQAGRAGDAIAVIAGTRQYTYRELNERANRLASHLRGLGAGPEVMVALCAERSVELIAGLLGILKAGGSYVPMDPGYPADRITFMLEDTRAPILLTQRSLVGTLPAHGAKAVCLDEFNWERPDALPDSQPGAVPSNLSHVIYTSGSTGRPKGVAIEHRSAVNLVSWAQSIFTPEELSGVLFATSICFDLSVFEMFVTLASGGTLILARNALELPKLPAREKVTLINTVPSAAAELLRMNAIPSSVRVVNLAGEPLKPVLVDQLYATGTVRKVYDLYGPSETTTYSTWALRSTGAPATIGRPIANTRVHILDANSQPVPEGVPGEIYIGGAGLARGYVNRPGLTAERFVADRFTDEPAARLYRTGDLARYRSDGNIEFLGRCDYQVKVRGYRVELGEIEAALAGHPAVKECVAMLREERPGESTLAAYVAGTATAGDLRRFIEKVLPEYMVPSAFVFLDALPRTPNGKVNRRALPAPGSGRPELEEHYALPGSPTEEVLAGIWRDVLGLTQVGVNDNFFELGGHSLRMTQVISRVRDAFQVEVPIRRFFEAPTIAELGLAIEELLIEEITSLSDEEARQVTAGAT
jgi:amino acid adenylation domain-containing protein